MNARLLALVPAFAAAVAACGGSVVSTDSSNDGFAGAGGTNPVGGTGGGQTGGNASAGNAQAGTGGASGSGAAGVTGVAGAPPSADELFAQRPGRPRSLTYVAGALYWVLAPDASNPNGAVETMTVAAGGVPRPVYPAEDAIACYVVPLDDAHVWAIPAASIGGLVRRDLSGENRVDVRQDGVSASDLVVHPGYAFRLRVSERGSWVERVALVAGTVDRVAASENDDAYVGTFVDDGESLFFSQQGYGSRSGLFRVPRGEDEAISLGEGTSSLSFSLVGDALFRVEAYGSSKPKARIVDAIPKTGFAVKPIGKSPEATSLSPGVAVGGWYYMPMLSTEGGPWSLARIPVSGGSASIVSTSLCGKDKWLPSLAASETTLFVACPGDGTVRSLAVPP